MTDQLENYEVIVGNIGTVYMGPSQVTAHITFDEYVGMSISGYGRAAGEDVTIMFRGEPTREHLGHNREELSC